jgi:HAD superfamily hydrolase (TIGR01509 family)
MNLSGLRGIIFDMDGLLVDSERLARESLITTASEFGLDPEPDLFAQMVGLPADGSLRLLRTRYGVSFPAERFLEQVGADCAHQVDLGKLTLKPGAAELVDRAETIGLQKCVATSSSRLKARHTLSKVGMLERFDAIITRDDVARGKPHPDLFLRAAAEMRLAPNVCLVLEDSYNGIRAAKAAAMRAIMVPDLLYPTAEMSELAEAIVPDLFVIVNALVSFRPDVGQLAGL